METHVGTLSVSRRSGKGKSVTRKLRQAGLIPAVVYGPGGAAQPLSLDPLHLRAALDPERKQNTLIRLTVGADASGAAAEESVLVKTFQLNPVTHELLHVDFIRVDLTKDVHVEVPLELEGRPEGVALGGVLNQVFRVLPVACTPDKIPVRFTVDVSPLKLGDALHVRDLSLPEGVKVSLSPDQTLVVVLTPKAAGETEGAEAAGAEGAAAAAPAASK